MKADTEHRTLNLLTDDEIRREALSSFRIGDWWMTHELLELLWRRHINTEAGRFYQGLLQAAVSLYHYGNGNFSGARLLATQALQLLEPLPPSMDELDLASFRAEFRTVVQPLLDARENLKPLRPEDAPTIVVRR